MLVLGIESTCDETGCALVREGREILANVVTSQIDLHEEYGGVVPELACRRHVDVMLPVIQQALKEAEVTLADIDLIAVAQRPRAYWGTSLIGLQTAKALSLTLQKPFIGVNHIERITPGLMSQLLPCSISSFRRHLVRRAYLADENGWRGRYERIGQTADDAVGEAFDKVAKLLGLPHPEGRKLKLWRKKAIPSAIKSLKAGQVKGRPFDFSFSGLKTGVLYAIKGQNGANEVSLSEQEKCDIAASFQKAAFQDIVQKTMKAAELHRCSSLVFAGGVTNSQTLRALFARHASDGELYWPSQGLSLDNAAMIAGLGYPLYKERGQGDSLDLEAITRYG